MNIGDEAIYIGSNKNYEGERCLIVETEIYSAKVKFDDGTNMWVSKRNLDEKPKENNAIKPAHYHQGNIDTIKFCEENFNKDEMSGAYKFNVIKYVHRYKDKGGLEDLKKAEFYLNKLIELEEKGNE